MSPNRASYKRTSNIGTFNPRLKLNFQVSLLLPNGLQEDVTSELYEFTATEKDAGPYECSASNSDDSDEAKAQKDLTVKCKRN